MSKRALAAVTVSLLALIASSTRADEISTKKCELKSCPPGVALPEPLPDEGLLPRRRHELHAGLTGLLNYNRGETHFRFGLLAEATPYIGYGWQALRLSVFDSLAFGRIGDARHGGFSNDLGGRLRISTLPDDVFDLYPLAGGSWLYSTDDGGHSAAHAHLGAGLRLLRVVSFEVTGDLIFGDFIASGQQVPWVSGVGATVSFDFCSLGSYCDHDKERARQLDRTCELYGSAHLLCKKAPSGAKTKLCTALTAALDAERHRKDPAEDATEAYLRATVAELKQQSTRPKRLLRKVRKLARQHRTLSSWRSCGRQQSSCAARADRDLSEMRRYAPFPVELRRAFGCDAEVEPCPNVCESAEIAAGAK